MVESHQDGTSTLLVLRPNRSASWAEIKLFCLLLGFIVLAIAVGWTLAGLWVVLPFAGLEFGLLLLVMYLVAQRNCRCQVIRLEPERVIIQEGRHYPATCYRLGRPGTRLIVHHPAIEDDLLRLHLADDYFRVGIGEFLNNADRKQLYRLLRRAGLGESSNMWWRPH